MPTPKTKPATRTCLSMERKTWNDIPWPLFSEFCLTSTPYGRLCTPHSWRHVDTERTILLPMGFLQAAGSFTASVVRAIQYKDTNDGITAAPRCRPLSPGHPRWCAGLCATSCALCAMTHEYTTPRPGINPSVEVPIQCESNLTQHFFCD